MNISEIEDRARRQLDGMRVNHDVMAKDVLALCKALRDVQTAKPATGNFSDVFKDIFKDIK